MPAAVTRLRLVLDLGLGAAQAAAWKDRPPPTLAAISAAIVDAADYDRFGRWGGRPAPRWWAPNRL